MLSRIGCNTFLPAVQTSMKFRGTEDKEVVRLEGVTPHHIKKIDERDQNGDPEFDEIKRRVGEITHNAPKSDFKKIK